MAKGELRIKRALMTAGILIFAAAAYFLHSKRDFSGIYKGASAPCPAVSLDVKRLQGFGDKNYLIQITGDQGRSPEWEIEGILRNSTLSVHSITRKGDTLLDMTREIVFDGSGLRIVLNGSSCIYPRID